MNQRILAEIGRTQRLEILNSLKRSKGMSVNELVRKMKMSYMGIKQHCLTLQRDGYLDTWRRPQKMGRPEMVYRLTRRSHDLFPTDSNRLTLEMLRSARRKPQLGPLRVRVLLCVVSHSRLLPLPRRHLAPGSRAQSERSVAAFPLSGSEGRTSRLSGC